jgi:hypothetical protein
MTVSDQVETIFPAMKTNSVFIAVLTSSHTHTHTHTHTDITLTHNTHTTTFLLKPCRMARKRGPIVLLQQRAPLRKASSRCDASSPRVHYPKRRATSNIGVHRSSTIPTSIYHPLLLSSSLCLFRFVTTFTVSATRTRRNIASGFYAARSPHGSCALKRVERSWNPRYPR